MASNALDERPMLGPADLAAMLKVPVSTIYRWRSRGEGPVGVRIGKHIRYRPADVDDWLDQLASDERRTA